MRELELMVASDFLDAVAFGGWVIHTQADQASGLDAFGHLFSLLNPAGDKIGVQVVLVASAQVALGLFPRAWASLLCLLQIRGFSFWILFLGFSFWVLQLAQPKSWKAD